MKRILTMTILLTGLLGGGCGRNRTETQQQASIHISGDTVYFAAAEKLPDYIKTSSVDLGTVAKDISTAGTVEAIPDKIAYIAPPFEGRVTKTCVRLGQDIAAHTPLFEIVCPDFTSAQKDYYQAQSELELARADLRRKEDLLANGVASEREYEEAHNNLVIAERELENAVSALRIYHADPETMVLGEPLVVRSPLAGTIIETNLITGQYIQADSDPVAVVANLDKVWITAQVKEKDIRFITVGDDLEVDIIAYPGHSLKGTVYHIEEFVDQSTRAINVLSICDNPGGILKIGMYATIKFNCSSEDYGIVPEKAIMQQEHSSYIYTQTSAETFVRRPVEVAFTADNKAYIANSPEEGTIIIAEGGFYLN